jgi:hypothetical protein
MPPDLFSQFNFKLLPRFSFQKDIPFSISFPDVAAGWIDVKIVADEQIVTYTASYLTDALHDLLEAVIDILYGIGEYDKYFKTLREHSRCTHDCEGESYVYDFKRTTLSDVLLLLRNSPDLEYEEELESYHFEPDGYWINPEITVQEPVVLAIRIMEVTLAYQLYLGCQKILNEFGEEEYKNRFGYNFPLELFLKLKRWLKDLPEFQYSL